jgi:hypothetical protein
MKPTSLTKAMSRALLVAGSVFLFVAAPAVAQVSSLDAYAGQAAVLGGGNSHTGGGSSGTGGGTGSSGGGTTGGGGLPAAHAANAGSSNSAAGGSAPAVPSSPSGVVKASPVRGGRAASGTSAASAGGGAPAGGTREQTRASGGSNPFSGVDLVVLVAGGLALLGTGMLIRRMAASSASLSGRSR